MYYQFFGVAKNPFNMTPDPEFLFLTTQHREALAGLTYAILGQKGFLVLTGEAGTGKTTLLARVRQHLPANRIQCSVILNPMLTAAEFLEMTLIDFGITEVPDSKAQRLSKLQQLLVAADKQHRICALIIDEAHKLSPEVLEEIRLLGNFERSDRKLLQILFLGQTELADLLNRPDLRQLKQRIAARFSIGALIDSDVEQYIQYRWKKAEGKTGAPFTAEAVGRVTHYSKGIPRLINAICDNALIHAFGASARTVDANHIWEACTSLDLVGPSRPALPVSTTPALALPPNSNSVTGLGIYREAPANQSLFSRVAGRLGLAH